MRVDHFMLYGDDSAWNIDASCNLLWDFKLISAQLPIDSINVYLLPQWCGASIWNPNNWQLGVPGGQGILVSKTSIWPRLDQMRGSRGLLTSYRAEIFCLGSRRWFYSSNSYQCCLIIAHHSSTVSNHTFRANSITSHSLSASRISLPKPLIAAC